MMKELDLDSIDVAAYIVRWCIDFNYYINVTKLQKLLYCVYGVMLAEEDVRICKEHPKAWEYGPVFPRVYKYSTKLHTLGPIASLAERKEDIRQYLSSDQACLLRDTVKSFGKFSANQLVSWTHKPGSPWATSSNNGKRLYETIPDELIKDFFTGMMVIDAGDNNEQKSE